MGGDAEDGDDLVLGTVTVCPPGSPWREIAATGRGRVPDAGGRAGGAGAGRGRGAGPDVPGPVPRAEGARGVVISSLPEMAAAHRLYERLGLPPGARARLGPVAGVHLIAYRLAFAG